MGLTYEYQSWASSSVRLNTTRGRLKKMISVCPSQRSFIEMYSLFRDNVKCISDTVSGNMKGGDLAEQP